MLHEGLYEQIINKGLEAELSRSELLSQTAPIDEAEAAKVLARYIAQVAEKGLLQMQDNGGGLQEQIPIVKKFL